MEEELRKELWKHANSECEELEQENSELEEQVARNKQKIKFLKKVMKFCRPNPCKSCFGKGQIIEYDGGDGHFETCPSCKGKG